MQVHAFAASDVGQTRDHNEDRFVVDEHLRFYLICDGMGGHAAGEVASENATKFVAQHLRANREKMAQASEAPDGYFRVLRLAENAVQKACAGLYSMASNDASCSGMGTTLTLLIIVGNKGIMAHVGDTRLYLLRNSSLHQLSTDHTLANELVLQGAMKKSAAEHSRYNHILTRSLGPHESVMVETLLFDLVPGDVLLLCSDGLSNYFDENDEIVAYLEKEVTEQTPGKLIDFANACGGLDNVTAIVVDVQSDPSGNQANSIDPHELETCLDVMKSLFLFRGLSLSRMMRVLNISTRTRYAEGETILTNGAHCNALYVVLSGRLANHDDLIGSGGTFGAESLLSACQCSGALVADKPSLVLTIAGDDFRSLTTRFPKLGRRLLSQLVRHLSHELQALRGANDFEDTWVE